MLRLIEAGGETLDTSSVCQFHGPRSRGLIEAMVEICHMTTGSHSAVLRAAASLKTRGDWYRTTTTWTALKPRFSSVDSPAMSHYIALIHKDADSCYGVSFPDWPGVITAADSIDEAMQQAVEVLAFAAEDWENAGGVREIPRPRTIDELRADPAFRNQAVDAVVAAVPFRVDAEAIG